MNYNFKINDIVYFKNNIYKEKIKCKITNIHNNIYTIGTYYNNNQYRLYNLILD
mgnify:CR=1 FL=1